MYLKDNNQLKKYVKISVSVYDYTKIAIFRAALNLVENKYRFDIFKYFSKEIFQSLIICAECIGFSYFLLSSQCFHQFLILVPTSNISVNSGYFYQIVFSL